MTDEELLAVLTTDETAMKYVDNMKLPLLYRYLQHVFSANTGQEVSMTQLITLLQNAEINPFPDGNIPEMLFKDDKNMTEFDFSNVQVVSQSAFYNSGLLSADLKEVKKVEYGAFFGTPIASLRLGGVQAIEEFAFAKCKNLEELYIPASCIAIESKAFANCKGLKSVAIDVDANSVTSISTSMLDNCSAIEELYMHESLIIKFGIDEILAKNNAKIYIIDDGVGRDFITEVTKLYPSVQRDNISLIK